ncbi:MAG TPA: hypothetical protein VGA84_04875 [Thermoanaerobaculia bacterium]
MGLPAPFALLYVPSILIVRGNATATANHIAASETLFRLGITASSSPRPFSSSLSWLCTICSRTSTGGTPCSWWHWFSSPSRSRF